MIRTDADWEWLPLVGLPEDEWAAAWAKVILAQAIPSETVQDVLEREDDDARP